MINRDVVESKLAAMKGYLGELRDLLTAVGSVSPNTTQLHAIERVFQLIVDAALDINTHIMTRSGFESSEDYQSTFTVLARHAAIPEDLAHRIAPSVGLRNLLVHGYEKVNVPEMFRSIRNDIGQYEEYIAHIATYLDAKHE